MLRQRLVSILTPTQHLTPWAVLKKSPTPIQEFGSSAYAPDNTAPNFKGARKFLDHDKIHFILYNSGSTFADAKYPQTNMRAASALLFLLAFPNASTMISYINTV